MLEFSAWPAQLILYGLLILVDLSIVGSPLTAETPLHPIQKTKRIKPLNLNGKSETWEAPRGDYTSESIDLAWSLGFDDEVIIESGSLSFVNLI
ncbi:Uncharacterized protein TCM_022067 [Theobroma cacao]|uniref:Uncharacterized protein n=1 Tax=Theobroma cacao TaxID=3641 RepID=A0A061ESA7_THECC|nr:Uncharacterized protein TCM_022067 [Theobroma cacao]